MTVYRARRDGFVMGTTVVSVFAVGSAVVGPERRDELFLRVLEAIPA